MDSLGADNHSFDPQRPFKVFLSLLDRWEIGASLSDRLVVPALEAIRAGLPSVSSSLREEVCAGTGARCAELLTKTDAGHGHSRL